MDVQLGQAEAVSVLCAGVFFGIGLLTGAWKWRQVLNRPDHRAHAYVDIVHRASLMYAYSALLLAVFAWLSPWPEPVDLAAAGAPLAFFAGAIGIYLWHAWTEDTENQFEHRNVVTTWGTAALVVGEIGGFASLFAGAAVTLVG